MSDSAAQRIIGSTVDVIPAPTTRVTMYLGRHPMSAQSVEALDAAAADYREWLHVKIASRPNA